MIGNFGMDGNDEECTKKKRRSMLSFVVFCRIR